MQVLNATSGNEALNKTYYMDQWEKLRQKLQDPVAVSPLYSSLLRMLPTPCLCLPAAGCTSTLDAQSVIALERLMRWMEAGQSLQLASRGRLMD